MHNLCGVICPWNVAVNLVTILHMALNTGERRNRVTDAVGRVLRVQRQKSGVSQQELALLSHVDTTTISRIERGVGNPTVDTLARLAFCLGVPVATLTTEITPEDLDDKEHIATAADFLEFRRRSMGGERP